LFQFVKYKVSIVFGEVRQLSVRHSLSFLTYCVHISCCSQLVMN